MKSTEGVVSCNQTAFFFFDDRTGKKRVWYCTMPALFLCSIPPSLGWLLIGVNEDFLEVTNHESGAQRHTLQV